MTHSFPEFVLDAGNKTDFLRGSLSPNLQARFCKLYPTDFSVAIYLFSCSLAFMIVFRQNPPPRIFRNRVGRVYGSAKRAGFWRYKKKAPKNCVQVKRSLIPIFWKSSARTGKFKPGSASSILHAFYFRNNWTNLLLSRNSGKAERKRPDREGILWKTRWERSVEIRIVCINFIYYNKMHCDLWLQNFVQESCIHVHITQVPTELSCGGILNFEITSLLGLLNFNQQNRQDRACRIELADSGLNFLSKNRSCYWRDMSSIQLFEIFHLSNWSIW